MITRQRLRELLHFDESSARLLDCRVEERDGYVLETLTVAIAGEPVRGFVTRPTAPRGRGPAILFGHSHGGHYDVGAAELVDGQVYLDGPPGPALARAGYTCLSLDMPTFGSRSGATESSAAKALLWHGQSLFGRMLGDHAAALSLLAARPDVDPSRIGAYGLSMGCLLSYWLAALDERIAAVAHLCCFADFRKLIELGAHDNHGIYLLVPGLLEETDAGAIGALIAPRPQLCCIGEADELTPLPAFEAAWREVVDAYAKVPDGLRLVREPGSGHRETRRMREAVLAFFAETLG